MFSRIGDQEGAISDPRNTVERVFAVLERLSCFIRHYNDACVFCFFFVLVFFVAKADKQTYN